MADVELAFSASARPWADILHRFLADHGGGRVRAVVMGSDQVVTEQYDVLIIDDICSFLTPRLVEQARRHGRLVVGVFESADGADAKRRLLDCNVDDVIEAEASPEEFLEVVQRLLRLAPSVVTPPERARLTASLGRVVAVGAPPGGCGATEVAVGLSAVAGAVLVDADDVAPAIAQRLGMPLHPNLRTAIDVVHHRSEPVERAIRAHHGLDLVAGLASGEDWAQLHNGEVEAVIEELALISPLVVVNVGGSLERPHRGEGRFGLARGTVAKSDVVVAVGSPTPVGLARLVRWVSEAAVLAPQAHLVAVVNSARRSVFEKSEVTRELERALPGIEVVFIPHDPRVGEAAWAGVLPARGPFRKAVSRLARALAP